MSIQDQSAFMEYTARSVCKTGFDSIRQMSGGSMGVQHQNMIKEHIQIRLLNSKWRVSGVVPEPLYGEVALLIKPYTPGMTVEGIIKILKANNLFGLAEPIGVKSVFKTGELEGNIYVQDTSLPGGKRSLITEDVEPTPSTYEVQRQNMKGAVERVQSGQLTGGLYTDVQQEIENNTRTTLVSMTKDFRNEAGRPVRVSKNLATSVNAITSKIEGVLFKSLPNSIRNIMKPYITKGTLPTSISGTTFSIGGGSIDISGGVVDLVKGNFSVDLSKSTDKQVSVLAAESVIAETGAVNADTTSFANQIQEKIKGNGTLADQRPSEAGAGISIGGPPIPIDTSRIWPGGNNVSSMEELEYEMSSATRDISEIIVHWSETYSDANLSMGQVPGGPGYHFIIKRDGSVERGTPLNAVGNHCPVNGHDAYSIGVCLVGGVNVASGDENIEELGANSITRSQFNSLYQIFRTFFNQYPGGQALGHMDVDMSQEDPGFDVRDYAYNNFNKTSLYTDPLGQAALSPDDILKALDGEGPTVLEKDPDLMDKKF